MMNVMYDDILCCVVQRNVIVLPVLFFVIKRVAHVECYSSDINITIAITIIGQCEFSESR